MRPLLALVCLLLLPTQASALLLRVDFTVTGDSHGLWYELGTEPTVVHEGGDPLNTTASGFFIFNREDIFTGEDIGYQSYRFWDRFPLTTLHFNWQGVQWTQDNASLFIVSLNEDGGLSNWIMYGGEYGYPVHEGDDFLLWSNDPFRYSNRYHSVNPDGWYGSITEWSVREIPEPGTALLLLAAVPFLRRRRI